MVEEIVGRVTMIDCPDPSWDIVDGVFDDHASAVMRAVALPADVLGLASESTEVSVLEGGTTLWQHTWKLDDLSTVRERVKRDPALWARLTFGEHPAPETLTERRLVRLFINQKELDSIDEYSATLPTGTYAGKLWKRNVNETWTERDGPGVMKTAKWQIGEYFEPDEEYVEQHGKCMRIRWYKRVEVADVPDQLVRQFRYGWMMFKES